MSIENVNGVGYFDILTYWFFALPINYLFTNAKYNLESIIVTISKLVELATTISKATKLTEDGKYLWRCVLFPISILVFAYTSVNYRSSCRKVFLGKAVLKICSQFTGEHPCRSVISIKLQSNFIEIALWHGCSPVNWLHIFGTLFRRNTSG